MRVRRATIVVLSCWIMGCGSSGPFDYIPVQGKITYEDGSPVPCSGLRLAFFAQDTAAVGNAQPRPAAANVNEQGEFDCVTSYKYGDGLVPGRHKVVIQQAGAVQSGRQVVPSDYTNLVTTPLEIDTADSPLHIKVPKP